MPKRPSPVPTIPRNAVDFWFQHYKVMRMVRVVAMPPKLCLRCGRVFRNEYNFEAHFWCDDQGSMTLS